MANACGLSGSRLTTLTILAISVYHKNRRLQKWSPIKSKIMYTSRLCSLVVVLSISPLRGRSWAHRRRHRHSRSAESIADSESEGQSDGGLQRRKSRWRMIMFSDQNPGMSDQRALQGGRILWAVIIVDKLQACHPSDYQEVRCSW